MYPWSCTHEGPKNTKSCLNDRMDSSLARAIYNPRWQYWDRGTRPRPRTPTDSADSRAKFKKRVKIKKITLNHTHPRKVLLLKMIFKKKYFEDGKGNKRSTKRVKAGLDRRVLVQRD